MPEIGIEFNKYLPSPATFYNYFNLLKELFNVDFKVIEVNNKETNKNESEIIDSYIF